MAPSLKKVWALLESSTLRERQDGVAMLRTTFSVRRNLAHIAEHNKVNKAEGKTDYFLRTITALINCVTADKQAVLRKNNRWQDAAAQTLGRLRDSAHAMRWLIENVNPHFNQQCLQALLAHIMSLVNDRGRLFEPIALDYTKALCALLSYPPHVQHISAEHWSSSVSFCFNAILGDKLSTALPNAITEADWLQPSLLPMKTDKSTAGSSSAPAAPQPATRKEAGPEILSLMASLSSLIASRSAPLLSDGRGVGALYKLAAFFELYPNATGAHAEALRSVNALLLDLHLNERKATRLFVNRIWHTVVAYLPTRLKSLKEQVVACATIALPIIACPDLSLPTFAHHDRAEQETRKIAAVRRLHQALVAESQSRGGVDELALEQLRLNISTGTKAETRANRTSTAIQLRIFQAARSWSPQNTLSWAALELLADTTAHLTRWSAADEDLNSKDAQNGEDYMEVDNEDGPSPTKLGKRPERQADFQRQSPTKLSPTTSADRTSPRKRRRIDNGNGSAAFISATYAADVAPEDYDALNVILDELEVKIGDLSAVSDTRRIWALQSIVFLADRHWATLDANARYDILVALRGQLDMTMDRTQPSLCVAMASCALAEALRPASDRTQVSPEFWAQVWVEVLRKVVLSSTSRAAAHAAVAMLHGSAPLLSSHKTLVSLKSFLHSLETEAPVTFADSTCALMREALRHVNSDVVLAQAGLESRVLDWVNHSWSTLSGSSRRSKMQITFEELDVVDINLLLVRICKLKEQGTLIRPEPVVENSDLYETLCTMRQLRTARSFLFEANLSPAEERNNCASDSSDLDGGQTRNMTLGARQALLPIQRRCQDIMLQSAQDLATQISPEQGGALPKDPSIDSPLPTLSIEDAIRILHFCMSALAFDSNLQVSGFYGSDTLAVAAASLFVDFLKIVVEPHWSTAQRLLLLQALRPLFPPPSPVLSQQGPDWISQALADVGRRSGVSRSLLANVRRVKVPPPARILPSLWGAKSMKAGKVMTIMQSALSMLLTSSVKKAISSEGEKLTGFDNEDELDKIESPETDEVAPLPFEIKLAFEAGIAICVEAIIILPFFGQIDEDRVAETWLVDRLLLTSDAMFTPLASSMLDSAAIDRLDLNHAEADEILHRLGTSLLTTYEYNRLPEVQILGSSFVQATMRLWQAEAANDAETDFAANVIEFFCFFTNQASRIRSWRVRLHLIELFRAFLEKDPSQQSWADADSSSTLPISALIDFADDPDFTVRLAAAKAHAVVLERLQYVGDDVKDMYIAIRSKMTNSFADHFELTASVLLLTSNVAITSSICRGLAMGHIADIASDAKSYRLLSRSALEQVAFKLGFVDCKELYKNFAANNTLELLKADKDALHLDVQMLGYGSRQEYSRHLIAEVGSTLLLDSLPAGRTHFPSLVKLTKLDEASVLAACFPDVVSARLLDAVDSLQSNQQGIELFNTAWNRARDELALDMRVGPRDIVESMERDPNKVLTALLGRLYDDDASLQAMLSSVDQVCAEALKQMDSPLEAPRQWQIHPPYAMSARGTTVYGGLAALSLALSVDDSGRVPAFGEREVFNTLHLMTETISLDRFVNDQLRHLEALKLWIAFNAPTVAASPILQGTILHIAAVSMQTQELAASATGIFLWCTSLLRGREVLAPHQLEDDLLLAARSAVEFSKDKDDATLKLGQHMIAMLEDSMLGMYKQSSLRRALGRALCAWPRRPKKQLAEILKSMTADDIRSALAQRKGRRIEAHHLEMLASKLQASQVTNDPERERFAEADFWQLLIMIGEDRRSSTGYGQDVLDVAALGDSIADLIHALEGQIRAPSLAALNAISEMHIVVAANQNPDPFELASLGISKLKEITLGRLLRDLRAPDSAAMSSAYHKLQQVKLADPSPERFRTRQDDPMSAELQIIASAQKLPSTQSHDPNCPTFPDPSTSVEFESWIKQLAHVLMLQVSTLYQDRFLLECGTIVADDSQLAIELVPVLSMVAFAIEKTGKANQSIAASLAAHFYGVLTNDEASKLSWSIIIQSMLTIRANSFHAHDFGFNYDLVLVARRAIACKLYSTALMVIEIMMNDRAIGSRVPPQPGQLLPPQPPPKIDEATAQILRDIYSNIDDPDGFYGIPITDVQEWYTRQLQHEGQWRRALDLHATNFEAEVQFRSPDSHGSSLLSVRQALYQLNYNGLASILGASTASDVSGASSAGPAAAEDPSFDIAWRMGQWDLPIEVANEQLYPGHGLWSALRALCRETDATLAQQSIATVASNDVLRLGELGVESYALGRELCRNLLSYREIRGFGLRAGAGHLSEKASQLQAHWSKTGSQSFDYEDFERICSVRHALVRMERERLRSDQIGDLADPALESVLNLEASVLLHNSANARKHDNLQKAMSSVTLATRVRHTLPKDFNDFCLRKEQASVLWAESSYATALEALSQCLQLSRTSANTSDARALQTKIALATAKLGIWKATARAESATKIEGDYFAAAIFAIEAGAKQTREHGSIAFDYAVFADAQYRQIANSPEHQRIRRFVERREEEVAMNEQEAQRARDELQRKTLAHHRRKTEKQLAADKAQLQAIETSRASFLAKALSMYATSLCYTDEHDQAIFPFASLWFENSADHKANTELASFLLHIPSHKFIPLTHQLSARLSPGSTATQEQTFTINLLNLLTRMCAQHPFHTLYAMFALRKAGWDHESRHPARASPSPSASSQLTRAKAADSIWRTVKSQAALRDRVQAFETACVAYVNWAEFSVKGSTESSRKSANKVPPHADLVKLRNHPVPIATKELPIDVTGQYESFVAIQRYSEVFSTAGGIHLPKINECIGTDGKRYKQLFKSEDDLRQDAVIQQVFRLVNRLLTKDRKTRARRLHIRGYIVLPLGPQCGLLEFVANTKPLGEVLSGLHDKYRVEGDSVANDVRQMLLQAHRRNPNKPDERIKIYKKAIEKFPPAMRYHFLQAQKVAAAWQVMRLSYVRSVATTSIVGHILGMGDRHVSNILMDEKTGEIIHIDFGIVFEQGKLLQVPELVPFRLTRDLVDGMGIFGVEGSFRRCCQETLRVMRDGAETIKTVLEVFKYDPLFEWMTNPIKLLRAQANQDEESNMDAIRTSAAGAQASGMMTSGGAQGSGHQDTAELSADYAVSTVMGKLSKTLSVEHTVNELIQQARDVDALGAIYFGWSAHL